MSSEEIDAWLAAQDPGARETLAQLRADLRALVPEAEEGLSYAVPVVRLGGRPLAGFSAAKRHLSYLPHSGTVLAGLDPAVLEGRSWTKGALKFRRGEPLPRELVAVLIAARRAELEG